MILFKLQLPLLLLLLGQQQDVRGTIEGRVFFNDGKPAAGMTVLLEGSDPPATLSRQVQTDASGFYVASGLGPGQYALYTFGVSYEKYPPRTGTFSQLEPDARIVLQNEGRVVQNIVMPPPMAHLRVTALNHDGTPVPAARIVLCHVEEPGALADFGTVKDATISTLVPSNQAIAVLAAAPSGLAVQISGLRLRPEEKRSITLRFKQQTSIEGKRCGP